MEKMKVLQNIIRITAIVIGFLFIYACAATNGDVVRIITVSDGKIEGLGEKELARIAEFKEMNEAKKKEIMGFRKVIQDTTENYTVAEYLALHPAAGDPGAMDYRIGGYDIIDIIVYEEPDLSRKDIRVSANGYISFPFIGILKVAGLTTTEVENLISRKLVDEKYILNAHVSVTVTGYKSKQYMVLGSVNSPGTYPLEAKERLLDVISRSGSIDFESGGTEGMIIRTENPDTPEEKKIVIHIDLPSLLKGGDQVSNILIQDKDLFYIPKAESFYMLGQIKSTGSFPYTQKEITLVEAISMAGGFTETAARNRTRILRLDKDGNQQIIEVKMDAITNDGRRGRDVKVLPGDVIIVPESYF